MSAAASQRTGLMVAMMEPPASLEAEFQEWYDTEHFPERQNCEGFVTAHRLICIDGWPRYMALYDLTDVEVMRGPAYAAIAVNKYSVWTHRLMPQVWGQYRAECTQVYPGNALLGARGKPTRVALWRFRNVPDAAGSQITEGMRALYEKQPETAQVRVFESKQPEGTDYIGIAELHVPFVPAPGEVSVLKDSIRYLDQVNVYVLYSRRLPGPRTF